MKRGGPLKRKTPLCSRAGMRMKGAVAGTGPIPSRPPRTARQVLEARADDRFRDLIRRRGACLAEATDGECWGGLQCAHVISRRYHAIRWDPRNAVCLCEGHHRFFTDRPVAWCLWIKDQIGAEVYEDLQRDRLLPAPSLVGLQDVIAELEELLKPSPVGAGRGRDS